VWTRGDNQAKHAQGSGHAGSGGYRSMKITLGPSPSRHLQGAGAAGEPGESGEG
jgi:hypothetical protein